MMKMLSCAILTLSAGGAFAGGCEPRLSQSGNAPDAVQSEIRQNVRHYVSEHFCRAFARDYELTLITNTSLDEPGMCLVQTTAALRPLAKLANGKRADAVKTFNYDQHFGPDDCPAGAAAQRIPVEMTLSAIRQLMTGLGQNKP